MKKNITIHDIAKELKLDSSTISRALNNSLKVCDKTKELVLQKAKDLGYHRNLMASNLRTNKTMTIGVIVPYISRHFFSEAIDGIEQAVANKGYHVIISQSHDDFQIEKTIIDSLFMNRVDGLLISSSMSTHDSSNLSIFIENNIPVVLFDRYFEKGGLSKVIFEDKKASFNLTQHIIDGGCKKIYHLTGDLDSLIYKQRCLGYKDALKKNNLELNDSFVKTSKLSKEDAVVVIKDLLRDRDNLPDALVCGNDISALSVMKYLDENTDIKVPEDMMIGGFSNEPASNFIKQGLTTIDQFPFRIGEAAGEMLLSFINNNEKTFQVSNTIVIRSDLIKRGSTQRK